ncbi:MAG TPA: peptide chain release factor 1 [Bacteroidales bacterium]|nr:peptide chain release factor 1 [Bacteroidales bacterium]
MLDKLKAINERWEEIGRQMNEPDVMNDVKRFIRLSKDYKELTPIIEAYKRYDTIIKHIASAKDVLYNEKDDDMKAMAKEEIESLSAEKEKLEEDVRLMLIPADPEDGKNAIIEIRGGSGGDEASIFAGDLYRMYQRYSEIKGWKTELVDLTEGTVGGYKEVIFNIMGDNVYGQMKYESGVHRVQRVPKTEAQGRVHTSAASVVVLPEADEFDVDLKDSDIRRDTYCSSGPGGQSVNTTYSAVRLTHVPTGIIVTCQDQKSQVKNLEKAMAVLRSRIYEIQHKEYMDGIASKRKTMVSTGDRSAKIRTYNYPQSRVTDHRIHLTLYNLQNVMEGNGVQELIDALQLAENAERLKAAVE